MDNLRYNSAEALNQWVLGETLQRLGLRFEEPDLSDPLYTHDGRSEFTVFMELPAYGAAGKIAELLNELAALAGHVRQWFWGSGTYLCANIFDGEFNDRLLALACMADRDRAAFLGEEDYYPIVQEIRDRLMDTLGPETKARPAPGRG